ncbi:efflux RND transporter periplasmic adaptor subunit, partial [Hydrogenimonas sp.]
ALSERSAAVADARLALRSEMENGKSALFEYRLSGQKLPEKEREVLLRKPHIEAARSALKAAEAAYEKAKMDLERCRIRAPFDAVVTRVDTAVGDVVGTSKALATLVRSDRFLVRAVLSPRLLEGIEIPGYNASRGSKATLRHDYWPLATPPRQGSVTGVEWGVDEESKMAYLLVEVDDPLLLENRSKRLRPLLLNGYVRLTLSGRWMKGVLKLPLTVLRGDGEIWTVSKKGRLHIRKVTVLWRDDRDLYLPADVLAEGESVVLTRIETPVEGMRLRIRPLPEHSGAAESGSGPRLPGRKEPR